MGCIAGALTLWTAANALAVQSAGSPYQGIVDRNVFGLKPPPNPEYSKPPPPPPPSIKLQCITTILGNKRALMKIMMPGRPGVKAEEQSFILAEGQRDGEIEVLEIDDKAGTVKVNNFGTITNLNFKNNGVVIANTPAPGMPMPGMPGAPPGVGGGGVPPPPGPPGFSPSAAGGYQRSIPMTRNPRMNPTGAAMNPSGYGGAPSPSVYSAVPSQGYNTAPVSTSPGTATPGVVALSGLGAPASTPKPQQNWPPEVQLSPEAAAIMSKAWDLQYQKEIQDGTVPPAPPAGF
jgi:hypothetical protein